MDVIHEICRAVNEFAPLNIAGEWDNVGVLVNAGGGNRKVVLTVDLTEPVLEECITLGVQNVMAYHPVIFNPVKRLDNPESVIVKCIKNGISVFSPHTALDPLMNNYVFEIFNKGRFTSKENSGMNTSAIKDVINVLKERSGLEKLRVCLARGHTMDSIPMNMYVGVGATFKHQPLSNGIIITGEMGHHDLLRCVANEASVILMEHSNSERMCLEYISSKLKKELPDFEVLISKEDRDPVLII